jgi:hypothetical protein
VISLLTVLLATALTLGATLLLVFQLGHASLGLLIATSSVAPFLVIGPMLVGSIEGYWGGTASPDSRRLLRRWFLGVAAVDVVAAVLIVVTAVSACAPLWVPALLVLGAAVLLAVARPAGAAFRRTERPLSDDPVHPAVERAAVRRKIVVAIALALLAIVGRQHGHDLTRLVPLAGQLTFTATAIVALVVARPLAFALRDTAGRDVARLRRIAKVVLGGKDLPLDAADQIAAARYALISPLSQSFQLAYIGLLYTALAFQFGSEAIDDRVGALPLIYLGGMVVVLVIAVPMTLRRIRRARRYAEQHAGLLDGQDHSAALGTDVSARAGLTN